MIHTQTTQTHKHTNHTYTVERLAIICWSDVLLNTHFLTGNALNTGIINIINTEIHISVYNEHYENRNNHFTIGIHYLANSTKIANYNKITTSDKSARMDDRCRDDN